MVIETTFWQQALLTAGEVVPLVLAQASNYKIRRLDCIFALLFEPYWIYYGYTTNQWGMVVIGFVFLIVFGYGFYHKWFIPFFSKRIA